MLARFRVLLPYSFSIPYREYVTLKPQVVQHSEYRAILYPPQMANVDSSVTEIISQTPLIEVVNNLKEASVVAPTAAIKINGQESIRANLLQVDVVAGREFARSRTDQGVFDPPLELFLILANSLIARLKSVGRMAHPKLIDFDSAAAWRIEYLTDDGLELPEDKALVRGYTGYKLTWQISGITSDIWELATSLPLDFSLPVWHKLILDATAQLPDVNPAIVLANAALESFIKLSLDVLAKNSSLPIESWEWLNSRADVLLKQPSSKERFDQVLTLLTGKSLRKDQPELWKALNDLRSARNSMLHEGKATIKRKRKRKSVSFEVDGEIAKEMVNKAAHIIAWVESLLPEEHKRKMFTGQINYSLARPATGAEDPKTELVAIRGDLNKIKLSFGKD